jgi:hypothetical protein
VESLTRSGYRDLLEDNNNVLGIMPLLHLVHPVHVIERSGESGEGTPLKCRETQLTGEEHQMPF